MTDWTKLPAGKDYSHWNGSIDWAREADEQPACVIVKATDGMGVDPMWERNRKGALDHGLLLLAYPFLEPADNDLAINHFLKVVGDKTIPPALDWEKAGVASHTMERWMQLCESAARPGLAYYGLNAPDVVTRPIRRWLRWYPQYPGSETAPPRLPPWNGHDPAPDWSRCWALWQWSEKGRDPAAPASPVDLDRLAMPVSIWQNWYKTGVLTVDPAALAELPPPTPLHIGRIPLLRNMTGDDVRLMQAALVGKGYRIEADGSFGPKTAAAIDLFKRRSGLPATQPVTADAVTLAALAAK